MLPHVRSQGGKICVLCINGDNGSAIRGVLLGKAFAYLEEALRSKFGNPDTKVFDYFDVIVGIGVGGVFFVILFTTRDGTCLLFRPDDTCYFFADHSSASFKRCILLYPPLCHLMGPCAECSKATTAAKGSQRTMEAMKRVMKEAFKDRLTLHNTMKSVLIL